jgi:putative Ca2+/H+ antiporter (TMEM165/GDT1 family)
MFSEAFIASLSMILVSEIGDKTFFIAAILAMKNSRLVVFAGAIAALIIMTILSAALGFALPNLLPKLYTHYASILLFAVFGVKLLYETYSHQPSDSSELEEVEQELAAGNNNLVDIEIADKEYKPKSPKPQYLPPVFYQALTMTFVAEWGDRSQIATIALATGGDPIGVTVGGIIGHACCTGLAVYGGKLLASRISERTVALVGGSLFLLFAIHSWVTGP